uniref:Sperm associated antigen 8 n=1 Tax=Placozoa sp. H4 TaxID=1034858 RepID=F6K605_9METZ|nr:sperm associated antigen 8 [Placozoa sp. H4]
MAEGTHNLNTKTMTGKTLVKNWVEERAVAEYDNDNDMKKVLRSGHKGLLTTACDQPVVQATTTKDSFTDRKVATVRQIGRKSEAEQRELYERFSKEVYEDFNRPPTPPDYTTSFKAHYHKEFTPIEREETQPHSVYGEEPITFWTTNRGNLHGESQSVGPKSTFRKNVAFSTPVTDYMNQTLPHKIQNW